MKKTAIRLILGLFFVVFSAACATVSAAQAEWRDADYNFGTPKFVLLTDAKFAYEGYDTSGRNKSNRFPYAADKISDMLRNKLQGVSRHRLVNLDYVIKQIKADPAVTEPVDPQAPGFAALLQRELGKHVDVVLYLDVRDYGWFYEWHRGFYEDGVLYRTHLL